jgi:hypothetical protein
MPHWHRVGVAVIAIVMVALIAESRTSSDSETAIAAANPTATAKPLAGRPGLTPTAAPPAGTSCAHSPNAAPTATTVGSTAKSACGTHLVENAPDSVTGAARTGAPALTPSLSASGSAAPDVTAADVQAYVDRSIVPNGIGRIRYQGAPPAVAGFTCGSPSSINAQLKSPVSVPGSSVICAADLRGDFVWAAPNGTQNGPHHQLLRLVFDGKSGWLLESEIP